MAGQFMGMTFLGNELNPFSGRNKAIVNIILLCTLIFVIQTILTLFPITRIFVEKAMFTPDFPQLFYQPWSFFTYIFLHSGFWHLFGNMLWLFFIGVLLEDMIGRKYIWKLFIGGGIFGALLWLILYQLIWKNNDNTSYMVGASAGVTSIIIGTVAFMPRFRVLLFGILPVELFWIGFFRVLFDFIGMTGAENTGGYTAHIGGAIFGLLFMLHIKGTIHIPLIDNWTAWINQLKGTGKRKPVRTAKVKIDDFQPAGKRKVSQEEIDRILDKINKSGYDSLSKEEKEKLFQAGD